MTYVTNNYFKRDFWADENLKYVTPHFRLTKAARLINRLAGNKDCDLLDVGCGPATLARLLGKNIHYYGLDIAIHHCAPNLLQTDVLATPINFQDRRFDIVVAQGLFEYVGEFQDDKLSEIGKLLKTNGVFLCSYVNFNHLHCFFYEPYSNVQSFDEFETSLEQVFRIERCIPTSYQWRHREPSSKINWAIQLRINLKIPPLCRLFAVEYFFVCSLKIK